MLTLKWRDLPSVERHAYCEKLLKLQERSFGVPRVANWRLFDGYGFEDTLREMMKLEYINEGDGDIFVDSSWERALSIDNEIYPEWVLEFFSTLYFDKDVDRNNLMKEKYDEIKKCSEPIVCEYWISKMLTDELDMENTCGGGMKGSSSGYAVEGSSRGAGFNDDDDMDELLHGKDRKEEELNFGVRLANVLRRDTDSSSKSYEITYLNEPARGRAELKSTKSTAKEQALVDCGYWQHKIVLLVRCQNTAHVHLVLLAWDRRLIGCFVVIHDDDVVVHGFCVLCVKTCEIAD
ncbi:hypothetical protein Tco_0426140 [Tanacetum coccineum]